jgi:hypothetical protein
VITRVPKAPTRGYNGGRCEPKAGLGGTNSPPQAAVGQRTRYPPMGIEMTVGIHAPGPWRGPGAGHGIWSVRGRGLLRRRSERMGWERIQRNWGKKEGNGVWNGEGRTWEGYKPTHARSGERRLEGPAIQTHPRPNPRLGEARGPAPNPVLPGPLGRLRRGVRGVTTRDSGVHLLRVRGSSGAGFDGEGWTNESQPESGPALPRSEGGRNRKGGGREEGRKGGGGGYGVLGRALASFWENG